MLSAVYGWHLRPPLRNGYPPLCRTGPHLRTRSPSPKTGSPPLQLRNLPRLLPPLSRPPHAQCAHRRFRAVPLRFLHACPRFQSALLRSQLALLQFPPAHRRFRAEFRRSMCAPPRFQSVPLRFLHVCLQSRLALLQFLHVCLRSQLARLQFPSPHRRFRAEFRRSMCVRPPFQSVPIRFLHVRSAFKAEGNNFTEIHRHSLQRCLPFPCPWSPLFPAGRTRSLCAWALPPCRRYLGPLLTCSGAFPRDPLPLCS